MAKVRVYELAKELNFESKVLVKKLKSRGMDVKNYMSTLDEDAVKRAKEIVAGKVSKVEVVEEKRVRPTVIRRRKKVKEAPPEEKVKDEAWEKESVEVELTSEETQEPKDAIEEIDSIEETGKALEVEPPLEEKDESVEKDLEGVIEAEETVGEAVGEATETAEESVEVDEKVTVAESVEEKDSVPEDGDEANGLVENDEPSVSKGKEKKSKSEAKVKKGKKKKVEKPAKIIKTISAEMLMTERPVKRSAGKGKAFPEKSKKPESFRPLEIAKNVSEEVKTSKSDKKKKGRKVESKEVEKKGSFRRKKKEIYERADLYSSRGIKRKGKRGSKRGKAEGRKGKQTTITVPKAIKRRIKVPEVVSIMELAKAMGVKAVDLVRNLMGMGNIVSINDTIDFDAASVVADEFGYELELDAFEGADSLAEEEDSQEDLKSRPPVVTIMGHVDHGKTLLLDYIRSSNIIGGESGGITQHIGAYFVNRKEGDIVFLDTPGHEAFTAMRARGAEVTDIIVLVVAADDGVMPQTREAIDHARAAEIPLIVAINKIDKPEANPEMVKRDLSTVGVAAEDWGGDTLFVNVSAKSGEGINELLDLILLQSEMLELTANPDKSARGTVIEAKLDINKGALATILIKSGTLSQGDQFVCGEYYGRVRAMHNHRGKMMTNALPSVPVEIYGISGVPMAGDEFIVVKNDKTAKHIAEHRKQVMREHEVGKKGIVSLEDLFEKIKEGGVKELNIILKTDVQGSLEALGDLLVKQSTDDVKLKLIHTATGTVTESDIMLASASSAIIIGFNVRANPRVTEMSKKEKVDIRYYDVIYDAVKDVRAAMTGLLEPIFEEQVVGRAFIKEIFHVPKIGAIAGCQVSDGRIERNAGVRLLRDDVIVFKGNISSLRRFKEDVKEVQSGYECGIGLENYNDLKPGDVFEVFTMKELEAEL